MSWRFASGFVACIAVILFALTASAGAADWKVAQMSGQVFVQQGPLQRISLSAGRVLKSGAVVVTSKNGRALLVRGEQTMIVAPNSIVALPRDGGKFTRLFEQLGQVEYNVDHQKVQHFAVETPYLAAIVKGTRFKVRVFKGGASVSVIRGRVEVTNLKTGQKVDVLTGQKAVVGGRSLAVTGGGIIQPIKQGQARGALKPFSASPPGLIHANNGGAGGKGLSAGIGNGGSIAHVAAGGGSGVSASVGGGGVASASVGGGGVSVGVGGVSVGLR